jgi:hypothetical protein
LLGLVTAACGGHSTVQAPGGNVDAGGAPGSGGTTAGTSVQGGGGAGTSAGAGGGTVATGGAAGAAGSVDANGNCPASFDYFITLEGDLPSSTVTGSCQMFASDPPVPIFDTGGGLDPSLTRVPMLRGCNLGEELQVWLIPPTQDWQAAGVYTSKAGETYATCGTSPLKLDVLSCSPVGSMTFEPRSDARKVIEGSYSMPLFEGDVTYLVHGTYRVCSVN